MITAYLRADRATLVRMRRVCRAWLAWFTKCDVEVHIKWPERSTPNPIHLPALRASVASFAGLTGLSLANHTLVPETFDIIGELVGPRLRHLSFAIHAEARPSAKHDRLAPFTNLETLTIRSRNNLNLIIPSLSKCTVMPRLHSLSLTELYFSSSAKFGNSCSFPSLTLLSLEAFSVPDLTGTSFYTQLRFLCLVQCRDDAHRIDTLLAAPQLREVTIASPNCYLNALSVDCSGVTALALVNMQLHNAVLTPFPNLVYLDVSLCATAPTFTLKSLPTMAHLQTVRACDFLLEYFLQGVRNLWPCCVCVCV